MNLMAVRSVSAERHVTGGRGFPFGSDIIVPAIVISTRVG
jgi:hypothetical protein